ncbi:dipeptide epimerase [Sphingomonas asaccharolytica]|uniref:dipeptide epimerase n=1 Tax=Sphingomonas asaccharolytica TaxID=40681 RepID=UPI00082FF175|nr:dipeptide epimerase [Sphingomonas asaccharolytica]
MPRLTLDVRVESLRLSAPFRIASRTFDSADVLVVTLSDGGLAGRGEASGVYYTGDDVAQMLHHVERARDAVEAGVTRDELRTLLPPGGARNAIDAALWDLEAASDDCPVWALAGQDVPRPLLTTFTLGADTPEAMAAGAKRYDHARAIKVKLTGDLALDIARVTAIRAARPDVWLGVDANQGFVIGDLDALVAAMQKVDVSLIEQPLARGREADLDGYVSPIPIAADESVLSLDDVAGAVGRFDVINIKLDKCGGLTEALLMAAEARRIGLGVMVGNMIGTSLAMAPAFVLGQICDLVDLDGPIFLRADRQPGMKYRDGTVWCPETVWGRGVPALA